MVSQEFEMTEEDLAELLNACKPTPVMFLSGGMPMANTPQENANYAWERLAKKMGFKHMTVQPVLGKGQRFFTADAIHRCPRCGELNPNHLDFDGCRDPDCPEHS